LTGAARRSARYDQVDGVTNLLIASPVLCRQAHLSQQVFLRMKQLRNPTAYLWVTSVVDEETERDEVLPLLSARSAGVALQGSLLRRGPRSAPRRHKAKASHVQQQQRVQLLLGHLRPPKGTDRRRRWRSGARRQYGSRSPRDRRLLLPLRRAGRWGTQHKTIQTNSEQQQSLRSEALA